MGNGQMMTRHTTYNEICCLICCLLVGALMFLGARMIPDRPEPADGRQVAVTLHQGDTWWEAMRDLGWEGNGQEYLRAVKDKNRFTRLTGNRPARAIMWDFRKTEVAER
ncbi:MAG: hypothetical protein WC683_04425 [bacterium]